MSQKNKGVCCILLSSFSFALMNLFVHLSGDLPSIQKSFFRNFVAMLFALFILLKERPTIRLMEIPRNIFSSAPSVVPSASCAISTRSIISFSRMRPC